MKSFIKTAAVAALIFGCFGSWAQSDYRAFYSGNDVKQICDDSARTSTCVVLIAGILDGIALMDSLTGTPIICVPAGVTTGQAADIVKRHINNFPQGRHLAASGLALAALLEAFPCPSKPRRAPG
jgi:hypothetical protein